MLPEELGSSSSSCDPELGKMKWVNIEFLPPPQLLNVLEGMFAVQLSSSTAELEDEDAVDPEEKKDHS